MGQREQERLRRVRESAAAGVERRAPDSAADAANGERERGRQGRSGRLPDATDETIIGALADDARTGVTEIAAMANISRATAYNRIRRLTDDGVIRGYSVVTDHAKMGLGVTALVLISGSQPDWRANREILSSYPEIEYCWYVVGSADIVLLVRVADTNQLRDLILTRLQALPGVTATQTLTVIDEVVHRPVVRPTG
ncbi:MAG: Lrp/AsnC family transcriptional regulator [Nocardiopsaceae bacterium]|nr:Lrp/AsnC family transcriptional regulator [Nocardiopsaceae bacterium]